MKRMMRLNGTNRDREGGAALITAMIMLVAMTMLGFSLITLSQIESSLSRNMSLAEEALFAAEEGALTGMRVAQANMMELVPGQAITITSDRMIGRSWYPRWEADIVKGRLAPQEAGKWSMEMGAQKMEAFLYNVESEGSSRPHTTRSVEVLIRFWEKSGSYSPHVKNY